MNVFHINCNYLTTALHQIMVEHLDEFDIQSSVFAPTFDADIAVIEPNDNVYVEQCFKKWDRVSYLYKQSRIIKAAEKRFKEKRRDLIHAYTLFTDGNAARTLSKKYGVPYVVAIRDTDVNDFFRYRPYLIKLGVQIMKDAFAVFFLSKAYKSIVLEKYVPAELKTIIESKSHIIPNGIDDYWIKNIWTGKKQSPSFADKTVKVIYAGRINKRKNIPAAQHAMSILRDKGWNVEYTVVGKAEDEREHKKIMQIGDVKYIPAQPKEKLVELYRCNDIFVMPSHTETFGLVYAEAMTQGLPVVYTKGQGFDGQFDEGVVGYRVDDNSPEEIADAIEQVVRNYSKISTNCSNLAVKFEWSKICKQYKAIYANIMKNCGADR